MTTDRDEILIRALVKAHAWRPRLESGNAKSIPDLAPQGRITDFYVCQFLPLTCLAPDIVAAILDGRLPDGVRLSALTRSLPADWEEQRRCWV